MGEYRKRPVVVKAVRWMDSDDLTRDYVGNDHAATFLGNDYGWIQGDELVIRTLEDGQFIKAEHIATRGDWLIEGVKGEHYPVKPDIFEASYEKRQSGQPK